MIINRKNPRRALLSLLNFIDLRSPRNPLSMDDPYGSIIEHCIYSSSQESLLNRSIFAREDELFLGLESPELSGPPDPVGGITIVSPPETPKQTVDDDTPPAEEYMTPPEESRLSSSQEQPALIAAAESPCGQGFVDSLDGGGGSGNEITSVDAGCVDINRSVDLEFGEERTATIEVVYDGKVRVREVSEIEFERSEVSERGNIPRKSSVEPPLKIPRISYENLGNTEELVIENDDDNEEATYLGENSTRKKLKLCAEKDGNDKKDIDEEIDNAAQLQQPPNGERDHKLEVATDKKGRRALPLSMTGAGQWENSEEKMERGDVGCDANSRNSHGATMADDDDNGDPITLMEALRILAKEMPSNHHAGADILETAKNRGMCFPHPRWLEQDGDDERV
ncbi:hypothetical protein Nepgr_031622 [Nepenthes gracilis]|uniref:Uncharacterized protein n=1 Tax=Nepenthes gracilis TaxID=150966 RepID=A0AAD3TIM5_NEPGR|nr:hypothetical protein Nepgr_031622 [Nepenthes gracilis]